MKCPKCGFQSFNYLSSCKKCGRDLSDLRDKYRLGDPVLPGSTPASPPVGSPSAEEGDLFAMPATSSDDLFAQAESEPEGLSDSELAAEFDEMTSLDPELAATLDPDSDWNPESLSSGDFDFDDAGADDDFFSGEPSIEEELPPLENSLGSEPEEEPLPVADPLPDAAPVDVEEDKGVGLAATEDEEDLVGFDFQNEEEVDLDEWLLDGEEPSWRRSEPVVAEEESSDSSSPEADDVKDDSAPQGTAESVEAEGEDFPPLAEQACFPEQAELPFGGAAASLPHRKASLPVRLMAGFFDAGLLAAALALFVTAGEYLRQGAGSFKWPHPQDLTGQIGPYFLVFFGLAFGYFTLFHYLGGQTPGKMAGKLLVVDAGGGPLQLSQAFLRSVGGLFCLLPAGLGYCSVLFNRQGRGWNDLLAGSVVVPADLAATVPASDEGEYC